MSEFDNGSHTVNEQVEAPQIQEQVEQTPAVIQDEPQYFNVKYNKEDRQVSYEEAPEFIEKGLNYDKVKGKVSEYENQLNRVAQLSGYQTHEELLQALDEIEQQQQRQQYEQAGIDPDVMNQFIEKHPDIQYARELKQKEEENTRFQSEANELFSEFPDLKPEQIPAEVWQLKESKGLSLLDSFLRVNYKSLAQQKEQEAIQKLQQNQLTSPGSLSGGDVNHKTSISSMGKQDFGSLVDKVLRGEVKTL